MAFGNCSQNSDDLRGHVFDITIEMPLMGIWHLASGIWHRVREWTKHGGHVARLLVATVRRLSRTAALVTATR